MNKAKHAERLVVVTCYLLAGRLLILSHQHKESWGMMAMAVFMTWLAIGLTEEYITKYYHPKNKNQ